jgi:hypothetical protein
MAQLFQMEYILDTSFFTDLVEPRLTNGTPDIAVSGLHIASRVWMFAIKSGRLNCSVAFNQVRELSLVSEPYAKQIIYVIRDHRR